MQEGVKMIEDSAAAISTDKPKIHIVKIIVVSLVLVLLCAVLAFCIGQKYLQKNYTDNVLIMAQGGSGNVTFRGAAVDDRWYSPTDIVVDSANWLYDDEQVTFQAVDSQALEIALPGGSERTLTFNAGPDEGIVLVDINGEILEFNLWNENFIELGLPYEVPAFSMLCILKQVYIPVAAIFVLILFSLYKYFQKKANSGFLVNNINQEYVDNYKLARVASIDGLRGILALIIALFHFGQVYAVGNTFHRGYFAVEVFFMLSGFLLANKLAQSTNSISVIKDISQRLRHLYPIYFVSIISLVMLYSAIWFKWNPIAWINSESSHLVSLIAELLCIQVSGVGELIYVNGPVWYVSALLLGITFILLIYKYSPVRLFKIVVALFAITIYGLFYVIDPHMNSAGFFANTQIPSPLLRGIAGLSLGCCLYWIYYRYLEKNKKSVYLNYYAIISCIILIVPMVVTEPGRSNYLLFIPASICILTMFWLGENGKFPILNSRPVQYLGKISYTFFVMQSFSQNFVSIIVSRYVSNSFTLNIIYLAVNLLLSAILYPIFEVYIPRKLCNSSVQKIS